MSKKRKFPHGTVRKLAAITGNSETWISKCINGKCFPSYLLALRIDEARVLNFSMVVTLRAHYERIGAIR